MGIGIYWIVDPAGGTAQVLLLTGEDYLDAYVGTDLAEAARITYDLTG